MTRTGKYRTRNAVKTAFVSTLNIVDGPREKKLSRKLLEGGMIVHNWQQTTKASSGPPRVPPEAPHTIKLEESSANPILRSQMPLAKRRPVLLPKVGPEKSNNIATRRNQTEVFGLRNPLPPFQKAPIPSDSESKYTDSDQESDNSSDESGLEVARKFLASGSNLNSRSSTSTPSPSGRQWRARKLLPHKPEPSGAQTELEKRTAEAIGSTENSHFRKRQRMMAIVSSHQNYTSPYGPPEQSASTKQPSTSPDIPNTEVIEVSRGPSQHLAVKEDSDEQSQVPSQTAPNMPMDSTGQSPGFSAMNGVNIDGKSKLIMTIHQGTATAATMDKTPSTVSGNISANNTYPSPPLNEACTQTSDRCQERNQSPLTNNVNNAVAEALRIYSRSEYERRLEQDRDLENLEQVDRQRKAELIEATNAVKKAIEDIGTSGATLVNYMDQDRRQTIRKITDESKAEKEKELQSLDDEYMKLLRVMRERSNEIMKMREERRGFVIQARAFKKDVEDYKKSLEDYISFVDGLPDE